MKRKSLKNKEKLLEKKKYGKTLPLHRDKYAKRLQNTVNSGIVSNISKGEMLMGLICSNEVEGIKKLNSKYVNLINNFIDGEGTITSIPKEFKDKLESKGIEIDFVFTERGEESRDYTNIAIMIGSPTKNEMKVYFEEYDTTKHEEAKKEAFRLMQRKQTRRDKLRKEMLEIKNGKEEK